MTPGRIIHTVATALCIGCIIYLGYKLEQSRGASFALLKLVGGQAELIDVQKKVIGNLEVQNALLKLKCGQLRSPTFEHRPGDQTL